MIGFRPATIKENAGIWNEGSKKIFFGMNRYYLYFTKIWNYWASINCWNSSFIIYITSVNKGKVYINAVKVAE